MSAPLRLNDYRTPYLRRAPRRHWSASLVLWLPVLAWGLLVVTLVLGGLLCLWIVIGDLGMWLAS